MAALASSRYRRHRRGRRRHGQQARAGCVPRSRTRLGVPVPRSIVVEDAASGIAGAKAAGMKSIGVSRHIRLTDADIVVSTLIELPENAFDRLI